MKNNFILFVSALSILIVSITVMTLSSCNTEPPIPPSSDTTVSESASDTSPESTFESMVETSPETDITDQSPYKKFIFEPTVAYSYGEFGETPDNLINFKISIEAPNKYEATTKEGWFRLEEKSTDPNNNSLGNPPSLLFELERRYLPGEVNGQTEKGYNYNIGFASGGGYPVVFIKLADELVLELSYNNAPNDDFYHILNSIELIYK